MTSFAGRDVAERAGVERSSLDRLVDLGILAPAEPDRFSAGDVRRVLMARSIEQAGIPLELLTVVREAIGMAQPSPGDRLREDEMAIVPFIELQLSEGFRPAAIERLLRVQGDRTRRIAEQEAASWSPR